MSTRNTRRRNNWFAITPCILAALFCLGMLIDGLAQMNQSQGWSFVSVILFLPVLLILLVIDFVVKAICKDKTAYTWLIELIIVLLGTWGFLCFMHR